MKKMGKNENMKGERKSVSVKLLSEECRENEIENE